MKFTIEDIRHHYDDELGDNLLLFTCDYHFTEPEEMIVKFNPLPTDLIDTYIKQTYPAFSNYMKQVWKSLDTWGPQQALVFEAMGEEAQQQYYGYVHEFVLLQQDWAVTLYEHEKKYPRNEARMQAYEGMAKKFEELGPKFTAVKNAHQLGMEFKTKVHRALRSITLEVYPQIMEASPERIKEFQYLFRHDILRLEETLDRYFQRINED